MTTASGKHHVTAHHAWAWHREAAELPLIPDRTPMVPDHQPSPSRSWPPPPAPAPGEEELFALITDAAEQARSHLLGGTALECAQLDDAVRLAAAVPRLGLRLAEIAERLGLDIADLRDRFQTQERGGGSTASA
jgi:hypothetical protein